MDIIKYWEIKLKKLSDNITEKNSIPSINIKIKPINQGRANFRSNFISFPLWVLSKKREYIYYYLIHEITHFITWKKFKISNHKSIHKKIEQEICKEFRIVIKYAKAYPKALFNIKGKRICKKLGD